MTSNHDNHKNDMVALTVESKGFQIVPLPHPSHVGAICTICLKYGIIRPFYTIFY